MLKSGAIRSLTRSAFSTSRSTQWHSAALASRRTQFHSLAYSKAIQPRILYLSHRAFTTSQQYGAEKYIPDEIDKKREEKLAHSEIEPHPEAVSADSSVRHVFREEGTEEPEKDIDMLAGVKSDLVRIIHSGLGQRR